MNERIQELAEQARQYAWVNETHWSAGPERERLFEQKFAELIVQECMKVVRDGRFSDTECEGNSHRVSYNNGRYGASSDIKKHFGVEE